MLSKQHHVWLGSPCHMHKISVTQLHFSNRYAEWVKAKYNIISSSLFSGKEPHTHIHTQLHPQHAQENFYLWILLTSCMYGSKCISVYVCVCLYTGCGSWGKVQRHRRVRVLDWIMKVGNTHLLNAYCHYACTHTLTHLKRICVFVNSLAYHIPHATHRTSHATLAAACNQNWYFLHSHL